MSLDIYPFMSWLKQTVIGNKIDSLSLTERDEDNQYPVQ